MKKPTIGVLALQGDFKEHLAALLKCGVPCREVRLPSELDGVDGLIIPGGESTTIGKLMKLCQRYPSLGLMDISVKRNEYGRQIDSFEAELDIKGIGGLHGVFIRAPVIHKTGKNAEILASLDGNPVLARQGKLLASTFHPELSGSTKVHEYFVGMAGNID